MPTEEQQPQRTAPTAESVYRDRRGRWLLVEQVTTDIVNCRVVAEQIGDRVYDPSLPVQFTLAEWPASMTPVDDYPTATGPDFPEVLIDPTNQTIDFGQGPMPYRSSSGPRTRLSTNGAMTLVGVTFLVGAARERPSDHRKAR